jgi:hypothetical protein
MMTTTELINIFSEGHGVTLEIVHLNRSVILRVNHPAKQQRYALHFEECLEVTLIYSGNNDDDEAELYSLNTLGIREFMSSQELRRFHIGFHDDSELTIAARRFWMEAVPGYEDSCIISQGSY